MGFEHKKGSLFELLLSCGCVGSQVVFFAFVRFSGGSDPRSACTGAVETYFSIFEAALKKVRFFEGCGSISGINSFQIQQKTV